MKKKQTPQKPLTPLTGLKEYISNTIQSFEETITHLQDPVERKDERCLCNMMLWEVDTAQKYRLQSSALTMITRLMPERTSHLLNLPPTGIWMILNNAQTTNVYFSSIPLAASSYIESHPHASIPKKLTQVVTHPELWNLEITSLNSHPLSYIYDAHKKRWTLNLIDSCPTGRCEILGQDNTHFPSWYICEVCLPKYHYWTAWFPTALMAVNLNFAEQEEKKPPTIITEREQRRISKEHKEISISHHYQVITFDISVTSPPTPSLLSPSYDQASHGNVHPTWLEQAISDETVLYIDKHIDQTQRTFQHERYINMRGKTITVNDYDKRIPRSVKRLKQTIYQAIAQHPVQEKHNGKKTIGSREPTLPASFKCENHGFHI